MQGCTGLYFFGVQAEAEMDMTKNIRTGLAWRQDNKAQ